MIFSIIIPTYNNGQFISEALDSLINQTIGFSDHFQVIVVDDGSTDNTRELCEQYVSRFPDNIEYIYQENAGVSAARNTGLVRADGRYINMLDADDRWREDAFENLLPLLDEHYDEVDVTACRMRYFGRKEGFKHPLDYKFKENRVVDITEDCNDLQLSMSSTILKREAIGELRFEEDMPLAEDVLFINEIIFEKSKYALCRDAVYEYRLSEDGSSAIDQRYDRKECYLPVVKKLYPKLLDMSRKKYGYVLPYIETLIIYEIRWRFKKQIPEDVLSPEEKEEYFKELHDVLNQIDEEYICNAKDTSLNLKAYLLKFRGEISPKSYGYITGHARVLLDIAVIENGYLHLEGRDRSELFDETHYVTVKGMSGSVPLDYYKAPYTDTKSISGETVFPGRLFRVDLPLKAGELYEFHIVDRRSESSRVMGMGYGRFSRLTGLKNAFFRAGKCLISSDGKTISVLKADRKTVKEYVDAFDKTLRKDCPESVYRIRQRAEELRGKKPIVLIIDRGDRAGDNAEALFKYLSTTRSRKKNRIYFAVSKDSPDFARLKEYGEVVDYGSDEYLALFLASDKLVSSQWAYWLLSPFGSDQKYVQDMIRHQFVFLQHGISFGDISSWGCRQKRNISCFITAANREYESIIGNEAYGYGKDHVVLTGFARNDYLIDRSEKLVVFAPTWRKNMNLDSISGSYRLAESSAFAETEYCRFYNRLINDKQIIDAMIENGYKGLFCVHPLFTNNRDAFKGNDVIEIAEPDFSYNDVLCRSSLMITDYSSVVADHAYMKKPIVYCQFDEKQFFGSHTWDKGYFDYETDGFGPVTYNYEDTVKVITDLIKRGCPEDDQYADRVDRFFAYTDYNNCRRICTAIGL